MKLIVTTLLSLITFVCYSQNEFKTTPNGTQYKIIPSGTVGETVKVGMIVQFSQILKFGDSILQDSKIVGNQFIKLDSVEQPLSLDGIIKQMKLNDSAIVLISCDTIYNTQCAMAKTQGATQEQFDQQVPDFLKQKNKFIQFEIKLIKTYNDDSLATIDFNRIQEVRMAYQKKVQDSLNILQAKVNKPKYDKSRKELIKFLGTKITTYKKTKSGAYVQMIKVGTGAACTKGKTAIIRYRGTRLDGFEFDKNQIVKGVPPKPTFDLVIGSGGAIKGFEEGIAMLRKGSKAKIYIPSEAGYGASGAGADIPPFANLIFEIEIVDLK